MQTLQGIVTGLLLITILPIAILIALIAMPIAFPAVLFTGNRRTEPDTRKGLDRDAFLAVLAAQPKQPTLYQRLCSLLKKR